MTIDELKEEIRRKDAAIDAAIADINDQRELISFLQQQLREQVAEIVVLKEMGRETQTRDD